MKIYPEWFTHVLLDTPATTEFSRFVQPQTVVLSDLSTCDNRVLVLAGASGAGKTFTALSLAAGAGEAPGTHVGFYMKAADWELVERRRGPGADDQPVRHSLHVHALGHGTVPQFIP